MANYGHIIFFSLVGGLFSLIGGVLLLSRQSIAQKLAQYATPFAAGALLAAVFLDLLKDGLEEASADTLLISTLVGIIIFFFAERFLHWFHHHHQHEGQGDPARSLIIVGDTLHNALDGVAIAAAFLVSVPTGIVTTVAVAAHEIPQEIGDFGLLLHKGMSRHQVLLVNALSALATTAAALITFSLGNSKNLPIGVLLGLSAGFLLYIAMSDLIPELHETGKSRRFLSWQPILLVIGATVVGLSINAAHHFIPENSSGTISCSEARTEAPCEEGTLCQRGSETGSVITEESVTTDPNKSVKCADFDVEALPLCDFNGIRFVTMPCFSPETSLYL